MFRKCFATVSVGIALLLSGCFIKPRPISSQQQLANAQAALNFYTANQPAIKHPITLSEAIARTLKFNLDHRLRVAQVAMANGQLTMAKLSMLPSLKATYDITSRSNSLVTLDANFAENTTSVNPRHVNDTNIDLSWSILDFGMSWIRAKQASNRVLVAEEQRRKVEQQLVSQVIVAYWQAYAAQQMERDVKDYRQKIGQALKRSKTAINFQVASMVVQLDYQQLLIRSMRQLAKLQLQLKQAKFNLARLMNINTHESFQLVAPPKAFERLPQLHVAMKKLDALTLVYRPELREASYKMRIAKSGVLAAVFEMLPNPTFKLGYAGTNSKYVLHENWMNRDINIAWDAMKLLNGPYAIANAKARKQFERLSLAAMTMGALSQVRMAYEEYQVLQRDYDYSRQESANAGKLYTQTQNLVLANMSNEQALVRRGLTALQARLDKDMAIARAYEALGKLRLAVGLNYLSSYDIHRANLNTLMHEIKVALSQESVGGFGRQVDLLYGRLVISPSSAKRTPRPLQKSV
jgi:outer membrane protein TolC